MDERHLTSEQMEVIEESVKNILVALGDDPERAGIMETPKRVAKMYDEVFAGMRYTNSEVAEMFGKCFEERGLGTEDMVVMKNIDAFSYCEHHMALMYNMKVSVAYIPTNKVVGLSKIARVVDLVCRRLQLQERIATDIVEVMQQILGTQSVMVVIEGEHSCMTSRGIKKPGTVTDSVATGGVFETCFEKRAEVYELLKK